MDWTENANAIIDLIIENGFEQAAQGLKQEPPLSQEDLDYVHESLRRTP